jgi:hypothetical protein
LAERDVAVVETACLQGRGRIRLCFIQPLRREEDMTTVIEDIDGERGSWREIWLKGDSGYLDERTSVNSSN